MLYFRAQKNFLKYCSVLQRKLSALLKSLIPTLFSWFRSAALSNTNQRVGQGKWKVTSSLWNKNTHNNSTKFWLSYYKFIQEKSSLMSFLTYHIFIFNFIFKIYIQTDMATQVRAFLSLNIVIFLLLKISIKRSDKGEPISLNKFRWFINTEFNGSTTTAAKWFTIRDSWVTKSSCQ